MSCGCGEDDGNNDANERIGNEQMNHGSDHVHSKQTNECVLMDFLLLQLSFCDQINVDLFFLNKF